METESSSPGLPNFIRNVARWRPQPALLAITLMLALGSLMTAGYLSTQAEVTLVLNGLVWHLRTHQTSVEAFLNETGIEVYPEDIVSPDLTAPIQPSGTITVQQARPVTIEADGRVISLRTHAASVAEILHEGGIAAKSHDRVMVNGQETKLKAALPSSATSSSSGGLRASSLRGQSLSAEIAPLHIVLRRAVPIHVNDDGLPTTIYTACPTLGEALRAENITLYLGDRVEPSLGSPVSTGMRVYIQRSVPVAIAVDGRTIKTRTQRETVADVLTQEEVALVGNDRLEPKGDVPLADGMAIQVVRVKEAIAVEQDPIPFETAWQPDDSLQLDQQRLNQEGVNGLTKRRVRVVYEDGQEVSRGMEDEWVDHEPTTKVIAYGTNIVMRELETSEGVLEYWRKIRMLATSYSAATCGKEPDHPHYGITFLGWEMREGIVAVDPRVINLRSQVYVPGYGPGVAGDTGGMIKGRHIDLGYEEDNLIPWYRWVDVYVLAPVPPESEIRWVLPNWPRERR
ncbi:MAG: ubiquitin-like domain-containing protein [Anaerolineae bacterium]